MEKQAMCVQEFSYQHTKLLRYKDISDTFLD